MKKGKSGGIHSSFYFSYNSVAAKSAISYASIAAAIASLPDSSATANSSKAVFSAAAAVA